MARAEATAWFNGRFTGNGQRKLGRRLWHGGLLLVLTTALMLGQVSDLRANEAGKARWQAGTITVYDYTSANLAGYVERVVAQWNAVLPSTLQLSYVRAGMHDDCVGVPQKINGAMVVCNQESWPEYPAGVTDVLTKKGKNGPAQITATRTVLVAGTYGTNDSRSGMWGFPLGCHELGHALGLNHPHDWYDDTCMSVYQDAPSASDAAALHTLYEAKGKGVNADKAKAKGKDKGKDKKNKQRNKR